MSVNICVLYNQTGTSTTGNISESDDDTENSAMQVRDSLVRQGHTAWIKALGSTNLEEQVSTITTDLVFNLIEWTGRDFELGVRVLLLLDGRDIPYTGTQADGYRLSSDKIDMKRIMVQNNIPTPRYSVYEKKTGMTDAVLTYPVIAKPAWEHCGIGVSQKSVVQTKADLETLVAQLWEEFNQPILVEEFIDGPEAHVSVVEKNHMPWVLPPAVFAYQKQDGYVPVMSYEAKWNAQSWEAPMSDWIDERTLDQGLVNRMQDAAKMAFMYLGGRSLSRVDMRIRGDEVFVLEINNNPGIGWDEEAGVTRSAMHAGLTFDQLVGYIVSSVFL